MPPNTPQGNHLANPVTTARLTDPVPVRWSLQGGGPRGWAGPLLVVVVAVAASASGLLNDYAQDDMAIIVGNSRVHTFGDLRGIFGEPYWPEPFNRDLYRPFSLLTLAFQWGVGGGAAIVFRVVSYLLYAGASLAMLALARKLLPAGVALGVALLFAAHPVHVEAVALGVNQGEQWVGLLSLLAVGRYLDLRRKGWPTTRHWLVFGAIYVVACLFKEHAVVMPGLFLATELTVLGGGTPGERIRRLWPGFAGLALAGMAFLALRTMVLRDFVGSFTAEALHEQGMWGRTLTMLQVVPEWLRLLIWPAHLQGDYSPSVINQAAGWGWPQTLGTGIVLGVAWLGWVARRRLPVAPLGFLWFAIAILPVSNILIPTGIVMAERTLFLPSAGFLLALGALAAHLLDRAGRWRRTAAVLATVTALLVVAGAVRSGIRQLDWRNHFYFWSRTVEDAPLSYRAHHAFGQLLWDLDYRASAVTSYHTAIALYPRTWWIRNELANRFRHRGECYPALELYAESLRIEPDQPAVRASRIACWLHLGRYEEAVEEADLAIAAGRALEDFRAYRAVADSAARVGAPPGTVQLVVADPEERW